MFFCFVFVCLARFFSSNVTATYIERNAGEHEKNLADIALRTVKPEPTRSQN